MGWISKNYLQDATYWGNPISDAYGSITFDSPISISVRWEEKAELFTDQSGNKILSNAIVFVSQDLSVGGYLYLGTSSELSPSSVKESFRIRGFSKIPTVKGTDYLRIAYL